MTGDRTNASSRTEISLTQDDIHEALFEYAQKRRLLPPGVVRAKLALDPPLYTAAFENDPPRKIVATLTWEGPAAVGAA